jgi:uncharacterized RDD family membrane protein YckC
MTGVNAGFGRRVAALVYDLFLLAALLLIYTSLAIFLTHRALLPENVGASAYLYRAGLLVIIASYYIVNWMRSGQTLGMRAWRIHAVSDSGKPLTAAAACRRFAWGVLAWPPAGLGVLWLYFDPDHLAIHDRLSRTRIIRSSAP